jgi:NAD-dependent SIR2 family protein deacetylase
MNLEENIIKAAEAVNQADAVIITAGAGIGVDSGLPDFRGNEGFWKAYPPIAKLGIPFTSMANPMWFESDPRLAWGFYGHRLNLYRRTEPHNGFYQLLQTARQKPGGCFVFTSNVDGHFQKAGYSEDLIEECHGSIHHFQCTDPCSTEIWSAEHIHVEVDEENFKAIGPLPVCKNCGRLARPNILMFGDWNWISDRSDEQSRRLSNWLSDVQSNNYKTAIIEAGAGQAVPTVRLQSEHLARMENTVLIRINPRDYDVPAGNIPIPLNAAQGINEICLKK